MIVRRSRRGDPSSGLGSSSSTCSSSTCSLKGELGKGSMKSVDWIEKSIGESGANIGESGANTRESGAATEGIYALFGKRSKIDKEDREALK